MASPKKRLDTKKVVVSKEESGIPIPLYVPNVLGYIRFVLIIASWPFAMNDA
jgi:hypothetical protein